MGKEQTKISLFEQGILLGHVVVQFRDRQVVRYEGRSKQGDLCGKGVKIILGIWLETVASFGALVLFHPTIVFLDDPSGSIATASFPPPVKYLRFYWVRGFPL